MLRIVEVEIDGNGHIRAMNPDEQLPVGRALLTILASAQDETALLSEAALAEDWQKPEEDAAWAHLQPEK